MTSEHSHEPVLTSVRASLNLNNPNQILDPVFGLLGDAAAAAGAGKITVTNPPYESSYSSIHKAFQNLDCLQQATADQAFTNAKAQGDVEACTTLAVTPQYTDCTFRA